MSDVSFEPIKSTRLSDFVSAATDLARPFSIYAGTITVCIGVFTGGVNEPKMMIAAGLAGVYSIAKSFDKYNETRSK
ncbi:MAG TPA: hypothetical protein VMT89_01930 [Candidatus Acidoferrales bacterium]|nr:hypothetical protein [Candidatus Acidoferrales bacterium]